MKVKWRSIFGIFLIAVLLELFVFNFRFWESFTFEKADKYDIVLNGIELNEELSWGDHYVYHVTDSESASIELKNVNATIKNVYVPFDEAYGSSNDSIALKIDFKDDANYFYTGNPTSTIYSYIEKSKYVRIHPLGDIKDIKISIQSGITDFVLNGNVLLNRKVPFLPLHYATVRIALIFLMLSAIWILRPSAPVYGIKLNIKDKIQKLTIFAFLCVSLFVIFEIGVLGVGHGSIESVGSGWMAHNQYDDYADAIIEGHFYLNYEAPDSLKQMSNPYDMTYRFAIGAETGDEYLFDYAFYNGKYYSYFGILPALLFFVPYKLITGDDLYTPVAINICNLVFVVCAFWFVYELGRRFFKNLSLGMYLIGSELMIAMSAIVYGAFYGNVYTMPIAMGLMLSIVCVTFWLSAANHVNNRGNASSIRLGAGSLCAGLILLCRPQLFLIFIFGFTIFIEDIKERRLFSKKSIEESISAVLPCIVVGVIAMYINYIRFDNPFNFGAAYNLTSNDMTHRGFILDRNMTGVLAYLFQPPVFSTEYPFMQLVSVNTNYVGFTSIEPSFFGGFIMINPVVVYGAGVLFRRKNVRFDLWLTALMSTLIAIIIMEADIQMSGITQRYMSDFGIFFAVSTVTGIFTLNQAYEDNEQAKKLFLIVLISLFWITVSLNYYNVLISGRYGSLDTQWPHGYHLFEYMLPFM